MSSVYVTEPGTSGRVVFETTHGPIEIQLWCRECPLTTKLFLQLCTDGFYQDMLFHRIMSDFLIQTGAVRQKGKGNVAGFTKEYQQQVDAPAALERRAYETHSRLRFNHRGQVAMAMGVSDDDDDGELQPQFFITLDEAPYLDGKHVLFGTCSGPTIFNALRIGKLAVNEETSQPLDFDFAPRVTGVKIVENPVHTTISATALIPWQQVPEEQQQKKKKKKRKGKKDLNVLSFGDEMEMGEADEVGIKSSHDVVSSKTLSKSVDKRVKQQVAAVDSESDKPRKEETRKSQKEESTVVEPEPSASIPESKPTYKPSAVLPPPLDMAPKKQEEAPKKPKKVSLVEARLARFKKNKGASKRQREEDTMAKLQAFSSKVRKQSGESRSQSRNDEHDNSLAARMARKAEAALGNSDAKNDVGETYHGQVLDHDNGDEERTSDWMATKFKCRRHIDHSSRIGDHEKGGDGRDMNDYEVIDSKKSDRDSDHRRKRSNKQQHRHGK
jgi:peptidyl-prolyl cis-trans isomerase SDCCAG10